MGKIGSANRQMTQTATQTSQIELISVSKEKMPVPVNDSWYADPGATKPTTTDQEPAEQPRSITPVPVESEWFKKELQEAEAEEQRKEEQAKLEMEEAYRREKEKALKQAQKKVEEE